MMAAAQPFLSGAISKTVNLPEDATVDDIVNTYVEGWKLRLKAIAIYRDGSKRSCAAQRQKTKDMGGSVEASETPIAELDSVLNDNKALSCRINELESVVTELRKKADEPVRRRMPRRGWRSTTSSRSRATRVTSPWAWFEDGQPGELFIQMNKEGSTIGGLMDTVATLTSIALQYGVPLESLVKKFAYQRFEPSASPATRTSAMDVDHRLHLPLARLPVHQGLQGSDLPNRGRPISDEELADVRVAGEADGSKR